MNALREVFPRGCKLLSASRLVEIYAGLCGDLPKPKKRLIELSKPADSTSAVWVACSELA